MAFQIVEDRSGKTGFIPRGAALELWRCKHNEVIIAGPAETGKTFAACHKLDALLWKYPNSQAVMVRKTRDTIHSTCLMTYRKVIGKDSPIIGYGGEKPQWFDYPNGSRLWIAGMDDPGKALSSERDFILVNQTEELQLKDWATLTTRATGRAGNAPYPQVMGDCNPGPAHHWIKQRASLRVLESRHEDNPILWDAEKREWTEQGKLTLSILDALPGVLRDRLRYGRWVSAEGAVYAFDASIHLIDPFPIPEKWTRIRSFDFGFTNPFVCQWWAIDGDGRMYLYRELYMTQRTVRVHAAQIKPLSAGERIIASVADHDAEDRATLQENGIPTMPAQKPITVGIQKVQERLKIAKDGKPRLFVFRGALVERDESLAAARLPVNCEQEFDAYQWPKAADGRMIKEVPLDLHNHSMDCLRYATMYVDRFLSGIGMPERIQTSGRNILDDMPEGVFG